jgi:uncharacterized protein (DUF983 family)
MAKKPAKRNVSNAQAPAVKKNEGEIVFYMGLAKGVMNTCPRCGGKTGKGVLRQYKGDLYCSRNCAVSVIEADEGK